MYSNDSENGHGGAGVSFHSLALFFFFVMTIYVLIIRMLRELNARALVSAFLFGGILFLFILQVRRAIVGRIPDTLRNCVNKVRKLIFYLNNWKVLSPCFVAFRQ